MLTAFGSADGEAFAGEATLRSNFVASVVE